MVGTGTMVGGSRGLVGIDGLGRAALRLGRAVDSRRWGGAATVVTALVLAGVAASVPSNLAAASPAIRVATLGVGVLFVVTGVVGIGLHTGSPVGSLLVLSGYLFLVGRLQGADPPPVWLVANLANSAWQIVVFYIVYTFPGPRLPSRGARLIVLTSAVYTLANNLFVLVTAPTRPAPGLPAANPFHVELDPTTLGSVRAGLLYGGGVFIVVAMGWLLRRWIAASPPLRRALTPVYLAALALSTVALALRFLLGIVAPSTEPTKTISVGLLVAFSLVPVAFLTGLLRARMARSAVADLVLELGTMPSPDRLRAALVKALGDPRVRVLSWSAGHASYVDHDGRQAALPELGDGLAATLVDGGQTAPTAIVHDDSLLDDPGLLSAVATAVRLTLDNERLEAQARGQLDEVRASRKRIAAAADEARGRIERDIHDGAQQQLVAVAMALQGARDELDEDSTLRHELDQVGVQLAAALADLRELARGVHPAVLTQRGLPSALASLARRSTVPVQLELELAPGRLPAPIEQTSYFIASEALANAERHARASEIVLRAAQDATHLVLTVVDDGVGGATAGGGSGITGMADRADIVGGTMRVHSPAGGPTEVIAVLPLV